jgi:hypothetical protein
LNGNKSHNTPTDDMDLEELRTVLEETECVVSDDV